MNNNPVVTLCNCLLKGWMGVSMAFTTIFQYAHANAIRQAKVDVIEGPVRVVAGIHSDAEILRTKGGPPIFDEAERSRYALVAGCRWVDKIVTDVPYNATLEILDQHNIDFVVHGNDIALDASGVDCLSTIKAMGRYKEFRRTEGISSTLLLQRIMHPDWPRPDPVPLMRLITEFANTISPRPEVIDLLPGTTNCHAIPRPRNAKVVYVGGSWDCFGSGHVEYLKRAKDLYPADIVLLVVGIWSDEDVQEGTGEPPLLITAERALAVIQCKYCDALLLNAPRHMYASILVSLGVDAVVMDDSGEDVSGVQTTAVIRPIAGEECAD
ncbi:hypothetical protein HWV62_19861 [Athelia sp. TMB]|nr:hypothetical protein HWV62_19861 [Athelia sp. TMB]